MKVSKRRLKQVAQIRASNVDKKSVVGEVPVRLCNYVNVYKNRLITDDLPFMNATASRAQVTEFGLRAGDILVTKDSETPDDIGVPAYVPEHLDGVVCGYHLSIIRPDLSKLDPAFLAWVLQSEPIRHYFTGRANGVTRFALGYAELGDAPIPIPAIEEQRAIVRILDEETSRIDTLIDKKRQLIELLNDELRAIVTFETWPDPLTPGWSHSSLMHLVQLTRPIMYGVVLPGPNVPEGVPIVKGGDVTNKRLDARLLNRTTYEIEAPYARARLAAGDLLLTIRGRYGDSALVPDDLAGANITQDIARIAPKRGVHGRWLLHVLRSAPIMSRISSEALGAAVKGVNIRDVKRYVVPVPPWVDQKKIAKHLDETCRRIDASQSTLAKAIERLWEYRAALITAAVTGQVDVSGAA